MSEITGERAGGSRSAAGAAASSDKPLKPATIYDVAKLAGVSHQSVAVYLRGYEGFRAATRERIEDALTQLNYRPNLAARSLARARSYRIGALVYELGEVGPSKTIQGASARAREAGYLLDIVSLDATNDASVEAALRQLGQQDLAGIIAFAPLDLLAERVAEARLDVALVAETEASTVDAVDISVPGLDLLVDHLVSLGHSRFFHISGPVDWHAARTRIAAFEAALARHGLESLGSVAGDWSAASGFAAVSRVPTDAATALVVGNDQMALGAIAALAERGLSVPGDISVTGFDDIPEAAYFLPALTTVRADYALQGRNLVDRLLREIDPDVAVPQLPTATVELRARVSTAAPAR